MYSYLQDDEVNVKKCKGIKKYVVKKNIVHQNYVNTLFNKQESKHQMKTIRSKNHQISSCVINKTSLSCYDDKRYILHNGVDTLAYGFSK